jgi:hypothetical protein
VGRRQYVWTDPARPEFQDSTPGARRRLVVWIWYPAVKTDRPSSLVLPRSWGNATVAAAREIAKGESPTKKDSTRYWAHFFRRMHGVGDASPVASPQSFPVVFFSPGGGQTPTDYGYLIENFQAGFWRSHPNDRARALKTIRAWQVFFSPSPRAIMVTVERSRPGDRTRTKPERNQGTYE